MSAKVERPKAAKPKERKENPLVAIARSAVSKSIELALSEDTIKSVQELKRPKDLVNLAADILEKRKDDLFKLVTQELIKAFSKVDVKELMVNFFENYRVQVQIEILPKKTETRKKSPPPV